MTRKEHNENVAAIWEAKDYTDNHGNLLQYVSRDWTSVLLPIYGFFIKVINDDLNCFAVWTIKPKPIC